MAAGLAPKFKIRSAPDGYAANCMVFTEKMPAKAPHRPYRLSREQGDAAHAESWDDDVVARFQARVRRITQMGFGGNDADDLAERLNLRDIEGDERVLCVECRHLSCRRCGNHRAAGVAAPELGTDLAVALQHCPGFTSGRQP